MKIVSWNLKNIGYSKLQNKFSTTFSSYGLGGNVLSYITNLVMGSGNWNNITNLSTNPADVFVVIELKTGGNQKGKTISGTCLPTLTAIRDAMNLASNARYGNLDSFKYAYATPVITGYHETVGVIYNTVTLNLQSFYVFRNNTNQKWINPRTPGGAQFQVKADSSTFQVVGIHAPPPKGGNPDLKYKPPIQYCNVLQTINPATMSNTFYMGDFNCNPDSTYEKNSGGMLIDVEPFTDLFSTGYKTNIPNGTLSSVRNKLASGQTGQSQYLNDAYDNIIFNKSLTTGNSAETVVDMIGNARNMNATGTPIVFGSSPATSRSILSMFNKVSDHLPVVIEW
ncbi:MAG: hypothetical protein R2824_25585 [Saprospiraceae bacterium]|nr:hypothetical protein [Lewinella sp.]